MTLNASLLQLEQADLVHRLAETGEESGTAYLFKHVLTQEAAYQTLLLKQRRTFHRRAGEAIERRFPDRLEEFYPELAYHFNEGQEYAKALRYTILAGDAAFRLSASAEAAAHYTSAVEVIRRTNLIPDDLQQLYLYRGRALELTQQFEHALENYQEMVALAEQKGDQHMKLAGLIAFAVIRITSTPVHDPEQGELLAKQALHLSKTLKDRASQAKALWVLLLQGWPKGWSQEWITYGEQSLAIARELGLREQIALTLGDLALGYGSMAQLDRCVAALEETIELWRDLGNLPMVANSMNVAAMSYLLLGEYQKGIAVSLESYEISKPIGNLWSQLSGAFMTGVFYLESARFGEAIAWLQEGVALSEQGKLPIQEAICRAFLGLAYCWIGVFPLALEQAGKAAPYAQIAPGDIQRWIMALLALIYVHANELDRAAQVLDPYLAHFNPRNLATPAHIYTFLAKCLLVSARKEYPQALAEHEVLIALQKETGVRHFLPDAYYYMAKILLALQRPQDARETLSRARAEAESLGTRRLLWRILALEADLASARGEVAEAQTLHAQARRELETIAAQTHPDEYRSAFLGQPEARALQA